MKNLLFIAGLSLVAVSCTGAKEEIKAEPVTYTLDTKESTLWWRGEENAEHFHYGYISATSGEITVEDSVVSEGSFVFDVNSIKPETEGYPIAKMEYLASHLKDTAFFFAEKFPEVRVKTGEYKNGKLHTVIDVLGAELTNEVPVKIQIDEEKVTMTGEFEIDFAASAMKFITEPDPETGVPGAKSVFQFKMNFVLKK